MSKSIETSRMLRKMETRLPAVLHDQQKLNRHQRRCMYFTLLLDLLQWIATLMAS